MQIHAKVIPALYAMCQQENYRILEETDSADIISKTHKTKDLKDKPEEFAAAELYESPGCDVDTAMGLFFTIAQVLL